MASSNSPPLFIKGILAKAILLTLYFNVIQLLKAFIILNVYNLFKQYFKMISTHINTAKNIYTNFSLLSLLNKKDTSYTRYLFNISFIQIILFNSLYSPPCYLLIDYITFAYLPILLLLRLNLLPLLLSRSEIHLIE